MPFKNVFEKRVNENMQQDQPAQQSSSSAAPAPNPDVYADIKTQDMDPDTKHHTLQPPHDDPETSAEDAEWSEKADRPPRFSTLFDVAPPPPPRQFDSYPHPSKHRPGVFLPLPLFVVLVVVLCFESTVLFAFSVIGLYNHLPSHPLPAGCMCGGVEEAPTINIAPQFMMPLVQAPVLAQTVTVTGAGALPAFFTPSASTPSSSATATGAPSVGASSRAAAAAASDVLGLLHSFATASITPSGSVVTVTGTATSTQILSEVQSSPRAVESTTLITVNAAGSTVAARPTVTATTVIEASQTAASSSGI